MVALHVGFVGALQSGLLMRTVELVVPVELLSQIIEPPAPKPAPFILTSKAPSKAPAKPIVTKKPAAFARLSIAKAYATPSPNAPSATTAAVPAAIAALVAAAPAATSAPPALQSPSSDTDFLQNLRPPYPSLSRRLNEQSKTTVHVLIGADGQAQRAEIAKSSGFDRLDQAAIATVMRWRYVPGKRGGMAEAMWFNVPINWVLE